MLNKLKARIAEHHRLRKAHRFPADLRTDLTFAVEARHAIREVHAGMQQRVPEILAAVTAGTATDEQLANVVELPDGSVKTWRHVTAEDLEKLRRVHAF